MLKDESFLSKLADLVAAFLENDEWVIANEIPVGNELKHNIPGEVEAATVAINGRGLIVRSPVFTNNSSQADAGLVDTLVEIVCRETELNTNTGLHRDALAVRVSMILHNFQSAELGALLSLGQRSLSVEINQEAGSLDYVVRLGALTTLPSLARVIKPEVTSIADGLVTLACATADAEVYYLITDEGDDSLPYAGPATAGSTLYTGPFTQPATGSRIHAAAFKTGMAGSWPMVRKVVEEVPPPPPQAPDAPQGVSVTPDNANAQTTVQFSVSWSSVTDETVRFRVQAPGRAEWTSANNYETYFEWSAYQGTAGTFDVTVIAFNEAGDSDPVTVHYTIHPA